MPHVKIRAVFAHTHWPILTLQESREANFIEDSEIAKNLLLNFS